MSADTVAAGSMSDGDGVPSRRIWELVRKSTVLGAHLLLSNGDGNAQSLLWVTMDELRRYIEELNDIDRDLAYMEVMDALREKTDEDDFLFRDRS